MKGYYYCDDYICSKQFYNFYDPLNMRYEEEIFEDEEDSSADGMRIYEKSVAKVMNLINSRYSNFYAELMAHGMSQGGARYLFRYIVYFTISNAERYNGNETQRTYAIFNRLRRLQPWVFSSFASTNIPAYRINNIIMTIIRFTLRNVITPVAP